MPRSSPLSAILTSVLSMSFISLSNSYARNFSITSDFHLQTYSSNLSFPINFCRCYFPLLDIKSWKLMQSNYCSFSNLAAFFCSSQCFSFKLVSSQTFFLLTALLILLVPVSFSFLRWPTKDFFLIGLILCLFLEYKDILSFCLFIHSNYFFLGYFRNVSAGLFWFFWMLLWIFPRTVIISSCIAADWIWVLKV